MPRSFLSLAVFIQFTWVIEHTEAVLFPANDATAKNFDNQLVAVAKNGPESGHGSEQQAWIEEPECILSVGVNCNSGALENFPDQIFEVAGISRRRLLPP